MSRLALDVDSTLSATFAPTFKILDGADTTYSYADIASWDWPIETFGVEDFLTAVHDVWVEDPVSEMPPLELNLADTTRWLSEHFDVDVVTAQPSERSDEITRGKVEWLDHHNISYNNFVAVDPQETKGDLEYEYYIDDKPGLVPNIRAEQELLLRDHRYNRGVEGEYTRVESVEHAAKVLASKNGLKFD